MFGAFYFAQSYFAQGYPSSSEEPQTPPYANVTIR